MRDAGEKGTADQQASGRAGQKEQGNIGDPRSEAGRAGEDIRIDDRASEGTAAPFR